MFHIHDISGDLTQDALQPPDLEVFFQLLLLSEFLEVATRLRLLSLLGKLSAGDGAGDGGRQRGRAERKNRENKSENLDKANHVTML